jgi:hypothetical protein
MLAKNCINRESNARPIDGNDRGYHYPINAGFSPLIHAFPVEIEIKKFKYRPILVNLAWSSDERTLSSIPQKPKILE